MSRLEIILATLASILTLAIVSEAAVLGQKRVAMAVIAGTIYESDGHTLTVGQGGKDWKVVFLNIDGENEQPTKIEYLGSTYRAEFDLRNLKSPVVTMCLYDGPDKLDCAMERMVLNAKVPIHLDVAFWPKQAK